MTTRPKRSLGQNFLHDESVILRIVDALSLTGEDHVIEIGPGQGALTANLLQHTKNVTAIEFDRDLIAPLEIRFDGHSNFTLLNEDALSLDLSELVPSPEQAKLAANLPYNISTPILQRLIDQRGSFSVVVLMFQREVAARITARPGGKERGYLSVIAQNAFEIDTLFDVPPKAFHPVPKVWSTVLRLLPKGGDPSDEKLLKEIVSVAFRQRRKTLHNNLISTLPDTRDILMTAGIDSHRRAETLTLDEWRLLCIALKENRPGVV